MISREDIINQAVGQYQASRKIDVIKLAQSLGINVYPEVNSDFNARIKYDSESEEFFINVNPEHVATRQRFSIAHELAHFVLHNEEVKEQGVIDRDSDWSLSPDKEKEADKLAAELLMPEEIVKEYVENNDLDSDKPISESSVYKIANYFSVSLMTAILRLKEVGYHVSWISFS